MHNEDSEVHENEPRDKYLKFQSLQIEIQDINDVHSQNTPTENGRKDNSNYEAAKKQENPKTVMKYKPNTKKYKRNKIYASLQIYDHLKLEMCSMSMKNFKKNSRRYTFL